MFTSDTERRSIFAKLIFYVFLTGFFALFGAIYEIYSHGVYSYFMIYAFAIPFVFCVIPYLFIGLYGKILPSKRSQKLWNFGIVTLTVGSTFYGVLDIFGTTNFTVYVYLSVGTILALAGLSTYINTIVKAKKQLRLSSETDETEEITEEETEEITEEETEEIDNENI